MGLMEPGSDEQLYSALERFKNNQASAEDQKLITLALASGQIKVVPAGDSKTVLHSGGVNYGESNEIRVARDVIGTQVITGITSDQIKELIGAIKTPERKGCSPTIIIIAVLIGLFILIPGFYFLVPGILSPDETATPTVTEGDFLTLFDGFLELGGMVIYNWNQGSWDRFPCDDGEVIEKDGKLYFYMPVNESDDWEGCNIDPTVPSSNIKKVSLEATILAGLDTKSWIGLQSDCGDHYLNFVISPEIVSIDRFTDEGDLVQRLVLESSTELPTTRTLSAQWTGSEVNFIIEESEIGQVVFCEEPSEFTMIFAGTNPGGSIEGYIDHVKIWRSEE